MQAHELPSLADAPGTSREYETIYILRPNTTNEEVGQVNDRVKGVIEGMGGKIIKVDNWGKRRLAYEVSKERKGIYLYWQYLATRGVVEEFERNMRMLDVVIRYMTVKLDKDVVPDARPSEIDEEAYERAATTAADEEDMYLSRPEGEEGEDGEFAAEGAEGAKAEGAQEGSTEGTDAVSAEATANADADTAGAEAKASAGGDASADAAAEGSTETAAEAAGDAVAAADAPAEPAAEASDDKPSDDTSKDEE